MRVPVLRALLACDELACGRSMQTAAAEAVHSALAESDQATGRTSWKAPSKMGCRPSLDGMRCSTTWLVNSSGGAGAGSIDALGSCATMVWSPSDRMARDPARGSDHSSVSS